MTVRKLVLLLCASSLLWPGISAAQTASTGAIAGVVKDTTGAVLPGVSVEVASPALIEKVRTVTTDGEGQYKLVDLRPGAYVVTFTLAGFSTVKRDGVDLSAGFTANVNGELKVGAVSETVTVSGATPVVDIQNAKQQSVLTRQVLDSVPTSNSLQSLAGLTLGVSQGQTGSQDVGGNQGENSTQLGIHGNRSSEMTLTMDGIRYQMMLGQGTGTLKNFEANTTAIQEVVMETSGMSVESETGGIQINFVPKDGGNRFSLYGEGSGTGPSLENTNIDSALKARGVNGAGKVKKIYDVGFGIGGPFKKDKLWFYTAHRWWGADNYVAGNYFNSTPHSLVYTPDFSRPVYTHQVMEAHSLRTTWQATSKQRVNITYDHQKNCVPCYFDVDGTAYGAPRAPEASWDYANDPDWLLFGTWTYPVTNRLLIEARGAGHYNASHTRRTGGATDNDVAVIDLLTQLRYNANANGTGFQAYGEGSHDGFGLGQLNVSYITGSHAIKTGVFYQKGSQTTATGYGNFPYNYQLVNGSPVFIQELVSPTFIKSDLVANVALYAQDQWKLRKLTLTAGVRFDYNHGRNPAQTLPAGMFFPGFNAPEQDNLPNWKDINPRLGVAYDMFGSGKTAVKAALGRYVTSNATGVASDNNYSNSIVTNATRLWQDFNHNGVPDCSLTNPGFQFGADLCGPIDNPNFGKVFRATNPDPNWVTGWGVRPYNWQASVTLQQELRPGMALNVGYYRTWYGNFTAQWNQAVTTADYDPFCIKVPAGAPSLPNGGSSLCGFYAIKPSALGKVQNLITLAKNVPGISGDITEQYNGFEVSVTSRFGKGGLLAGGVSTAQTVANNCALSNRPDVAGTLFGSAFAFNAYTSAVTTQLANPATAFCKQTIPWSAQTQVKANVVYPLPLGFETAASFQNIAGPADKANLYTTDLAASSNLGRGPAECASLVGVPCVVGVTNLFEPNTKYEDRLTQVDFRLSKKIPVGRANIRASFDIYNLFNANSVLIVSSAYGPTWPKPILVLAARLFKFGATVEF